MIEMRPCDYCDKPIYRERSEYAKYKYNFCSGSCASKFTKWKNENTIKSYGPHDPVFDAHPNQIQPPWLVVTSPWFRTDERSFDRQTIRAVNVHERIPESRMAQISYMRKCGWNYSEIADELGISEAQAKHARGKKLGWKVTKRGRV